MSESRTHLKASLPVASSSKMAKTQKDKCDSILSKTAVVYNIEKAKTTTKKAEIFIYKFYVNQQIDTMPIGLYTLNSINYSQA